MQILRTGSKLTTSTLFVFVSAALAAGCGGTTVFAGQNPVSIVGELPAPPPPPPPKKEEPPPPPPKVVVKDNKIEITEKIQFEYNKAVIKPESFALMNEIGDTIKKNDHIKKIAVEGHASSEGSAAHNKKLSEERAKAVVAYLVEKSGIKPEVFTAKGYGSEKMLVKPENSEEDREKNRRVEFNILEQDVTKKKIAVDATTGKETVLEEKKIEEKKPEDKSADVKTEDKKDEKKKAPAKPKSK